MSTYNIGFYEDLTKIIFELSSNIIKYPPYFFCWLNNKDIDLQAVWICAFIIQRKRYDVYLMKFDDN